MTRHLYRLILLASISFASTNLHSDVYRWVDEQGNVHFSDKTHGNKKVKDITSDVQLKNLDHSADRTQQSLQQIELRQQAQSTENQQRQSQQNNNSEKIDQTCHQARQRLRTIQGRVYFIDKNGNEIKVTERERQQRASALQEKIKQNCN